MVTELAGAVCDSRHERCVRLHRTRRLSAVPSLPRQQPVLGCCRRELRQLSAAPNGPSAPVPASPRPNSMT